MMKPVARMQGAGASAVAGRVVWSPAKSLWNMSMLACAIVFAPWVVTPAALLLFGVTTYCSLLLGHSVGMHRRFIHRSYACAKWLERSLVYVGVLVGVAGPFGILRVHDERDWAQFHSPKNLAMALVAEAGELVEQFQWLTEAQSADLTPEKLEAVRLEMADVFIYLARLADVLGVDLLAAADDKLAINERRYPAERVRGHARKYDEY